jgi:hypothetical protein
MEARRAHQERKRKAALGDGALSFGTGQHLARQTNHARHDQIGQAAQALDIASPSGLEHRARMVDHRPTGSPQQPRRGFEAFAAQFGIADAVEDQIVRRQRHVRIGIFRHQDGGQELPVVEKSRRRNVAAGGRDQQQDRDRRAIAAIRQCGLVMIPERLVAVPPGAGRVAKLGQEIAHAAMRVDMIRIEALHANTDRVGLTMPTQCF